MTNKNQAFLGELTALSKKYDMWIGGCGCCESPWAYGHIEDSSEARPTGYKADFNADGMISNIESISKA